MKYLVLGHKGAIGRNLCSLLKTNGEEVDITYSDLRYSSYYSDYYSKIRNADFVFFLAFDVGGSHFMKEYEKSFEFLHNNLSMMDTIFRALREHNKPFVFITTSLNEDINSIHGNVKLVGERFAQSLGGIVIRLWNVYGSREKEEKRFHVINDFIKQAKENQIIRIKSDGQERRQFLHVEDCCNGLYKASKLPYGWYQYYDITSFEWTKIEDIAKIICEELGSTYQLSQEKETNKMYYEPSDISLSFWKPLISLREGIKKTIKQF